MTKNIIGLCLITQRDLIYQRSGIRIKDIKESEVLGAISLVGLFGVMYLWIWILA